MEAQEVIEYSRDILSIPRLYTALAEWAACMGFVFLSERRFHKVKTLLLSSIWLLLMGAFLQLTADAAPGLPWISAMCAAVLLMGTLIGALCKADRNAVIYMTACAFLLAEFCASLEWQLEMWMDVYGLRLAGVRVLFVIIIYCGVCTLFFALERRMIREEFFSDLSVRPVVSTVLISIITFFLSNLSFLTHMSPFATENIGDIFNYRTMIDFAGLMLLYATQSTMHAYIQGKELSYIRATLRSQYQEYLNYQKSMELIRVTLHDVKHQLTGLRAETDPEKRKVWIEEMEKELSPTRDVQQTGNPVLDAVIGAKQLQARQADIRLTCVIDGELLSFMHVRDICNVFGNALDNAIESVTMLKDAQERLIHVTVSSQKQFVMIQIRNYCDKEKKDWTGAFPRTSKKDRDSHGYGLKSIAHTVEKYKGSVTADVRDHWFELGILLPVPGAA